MTPYYADDQVAIYHGDCREVLAALVESEGFQAFPTCICDPPYGLRFMGKGWDHDVPGEDFWRIIGAALLPGASIMAFGGTRTWHRLAVAIEDAGLEIRDTLLWLYGQGFSKGFNFRRCDLCDCISSGNPLHYSHENEMPDLWQDVQVFPVPSASGGGGDVLQEMQRDSTVGGAAEVQRQHEGQEAEGQAVGVRQRDVARGALRGAREGVCAGEATGPSSREGERVRAGAHLGCGEDAGASAEGRRGSASSESRQGGQSTGEPTGVRESRGPLGDGALRGRGACPRCGKLRREYAGYSTCLKPAWEPILWAMKPVDDTFAHNALTHGVAGINVDGGRIGLDVRINQPMGRPRVSYGGYTASASASASVVVGRWPSNVLHDGSEEVVGMFPQTKSGQESAAGHVRNAPAERTSIYGGGRGLWRDAGPAGSLIGDSGSAARFFYTAKATTRERERYLRGQLPCVKCGGVDSRTHPDALGRPIPCRRCGHPTVKPLALMRYLCRLTSTPTGGTVLDPFCGSGSTLVAAVMEGRQAVGIDSDLESCRLAAARVRRVPRRLPAATARSTP